MFVLRISPSAGADYTFTFGQHPADVNGRGAERRRFGYAWIEG
jgi:hypothetical protein